MEIIDPVNDVGPAPLTTIASVAPYLDAWSSGFSVAAALVALDGRMLWGNQAAMDMIAQGDRLSLVDQKLVVADTGQRAAFRAFVSNVTTEVTAWVYRDGEGALLAVRGEAVAPIGHKPAVALMFRPADQTAEYIWADFGAILGLTPAEATVVKRTIAGDRAQVIATDLGVTLETVRTHIKRIYQKLDISSREQLFSKISHFRIV